MNGKRAGWCGRYLSLRQRSSHYDTFRNVPWYDRAFSFRISCLENLEKSSLYVFARWPLKQFSSRQVVRRIHILNFIELVSIPGRASSVVIWNVWDASDVQAVLSRVSLRYFSQFLSALTAEVSLEFVVCCLARVASVSVSRKWPVNSKTDLANSRLSSDLPRRFLFWNMRRILYRNTRTVMVRAGLWVLACFRLDSYTQFAGSEVNMPKFSPNNPTNTFRFSFRRARRLCFFLEFFLLELQVSEGTNLQSFDFQEIGFFDEPTHSTGALTTALATHASAVKGVCTGLVFVSLFILARLLLLDGSGVPWETFPRCLWHRSSGNLKLIGLEEWKG